MDKIDMSKKIVIKYYYFVWIVLVSLPQFLLAWSVGESIVPSEGNNGGWHFDQIIQLIDNLLYVFIWIAIPVSTILFAWIGWELMSGESKPSAISKAKERLKILLIGMIFVLIPWLLVKMIISGLGADGADNLLK